MTLKLRNLRFLTRLFIILVSLRRSLFSEKMLISNRCISGLMSNLIKKSWMVSIQAFQSAFLNNSLNFHQNSEWMQIAYPYSISTQHDLFPFVYLKLFLTMAPMKVLPGFKVWFFNVKTIIQCGYTSDFSIGLPKKKKISIFYFSLFTSSHTYMFY